MHHIGYTAACSPAASCTLLHTLLPTHTHTRTCPGPGLSRCASRPAACRHPLPPPPARTQRAPEPPAPLPRATAPRCCAAARAGCQTCCPAARCPAEGQGRCDRLRARAVKAGTHRQGSTQLRLVHRASMQEQCNTFLAGNSLTASHNPNAEQQAKPTQCLPERRCGGAAAQP